MGNEKKYYRFYKEDEQWFIDLPEYLEEFGEQGDLAMVLGADTLLDHLSDNGNEIELELELDKKYTTELYWDMIQKAKNNPFESGATYVYDTGVEMIVAWLCPVTEYVFGNYPDFIYFKKKDKSLIKY